MKKHAFILLLLFLLIGPLAVPQINVHAQDCDPATGANCPPPPQSEEKEKDKEEKKNRDAIQIQPTITFTIAFIPPTATPTLTSIPAAETQRPTSALVEAAIPSPATTRRVSTASTFNGATIGIIGGLIIVFGLWFTARTFADGSVRKKSSLNPRAMLDGSVKGGSTVEKMDGSAKPNSVIPKSKTKK